MKASKILVIFILIVSVVSSAAFAAGDTDYGKILGELGIIRGTDKGYEPDKTLTRAEAAAVIVRLLGEEDNLGEKNYTQNFADVPPAHWAFDYIMYCYSEGITKGTGEDTFSPGTTIDAGQFVTLVLRLMGYEDTEYEKAVDTAVDYSLFNSEVAESLKSSGSFTRGDMFYVVYRCLKTHMSDGTLFAQYLADKGVIPQSRADDFDVYDDFENIDELLEELLN